MGPKCYAFVLADGARHVRGSDLASLLRCCMHWFFPAAAQAECVCGTVTAAPLAPATRWMFAALSVRI